MNEGVDTSLASEGIDLFVDLWGGAVLVSGTENGIVVSSSTL